MQVGSLQWAPDSYRDGSWQWAPDSYRDGSLQLAVCSRSFDYRSGLSGGLRKEKKEAISSETASFQHRVLFPIAIGIWSYTET